MTPQDPIPERAELRAWLGDPARSPRQQGKLHESDAEILRWAGSADRLALTTDSLSEEWHCRLYQDPFTLGWMTATASLSDLAAVGAEPLGLLLNVEWPPDFALSQKQGFAAGLHAALADAGTFLLGGDSGRNPSGSWGATAVGRVAGDPMSRLGLQEGDILGLVRAPREEASLGRGPALGIRLLEEAAPDHFPEGLFRPAPALAAGQRLLEAGVRTCIDTSDGLLSSLALLSALNENRGFALEWSESALSAPAAAFCRDLNLPLFLLWAHEHGDYQLLFAASESLCDTLEAGGKIVFDRIGRVLAPGAPSVLYCEEGRAVPLSLGFAREILNRKEASWKEREAALVQACREKGLP
jgi:thiamine-monophosphate kinase